MRYRGDDGDFDTTSSTDPNGALLVGGHWSLLDDHTLTLSIDVAGGVRSLLLKAVGTNGSGLDYRFDFGDDLSDWSGAAPAGFTAGFCARDRCGLQNVADRTLRSDIDLIERGQGSR